MEIKKKFIKFNYSTNNKPVYIVIHNTDNPSATASNHYKYWNGGNQGSSAHYVVDDKEIIHLVDHNNQSWHCGKKYISKPEVAKCTNANSIGIEVCNARQMDFDKCMDNTIYLVKKLMRDLNIPIENVITHKQACGKQCPSTILKLNKWEWFKSELVEESETTMNKIKIKLNGVVKEVEAINKDGSNFVKLQDIRDDKISVGYDDKSKMPVIDVVPTNLSKSTKELIGEFELTAYCSCEKCNGRWYGYPAKNGEPLKEGYTIAVDPDVIPLNDWVEIDGIGERKACDVGNAIKGNKIDILFDSHEAAIKFGRKNKIKVYKVVK